MNDRRQMVQVIHHLYRPDLHTDQPNTEIVTADGQHFQVNPTGEVSMLVGDYYLPMAAVPQASPQQRWLLRTIPLAVVGGAVLATFLVVSFWLLFPVSSAVQEAYYGIVASLGWWTAQLLNLLLLLFVGRLFWLVTRSVSDISFLRSAATVSDEEPAIAHDAVCIVASRTPGDATLDERFTFALAQLANDRSPVVCVALLRFRDPVGYLRVAGKSAQQFAREKPVEIAPMPGDYKDTIWAGESWEQFKAYEDAYTVRLRDYAMRHLHKAASAVPADQRDAELSNILRRTATTVALLIGFAMSLSAQKSQQVLDYLGRDRYEAFKPVGKVNFVFEEAVITRRGDGKFSVKQLLPDAVYYSDASNAGKLLRITVDNRVLAPASADPEPTPTPAPQPKADKMQPAPTTGYQPGRSGSIDPVRPRPFNDAPTTTEAPGGGSGFHVPDSATVANNLEQAKNAVSNEAYNLTRSAHPVWDFLFWLFQGILSLLICFIGLMRYFAKSAANESLVNIKGRTIVGGWIVIAQQNAAGVTLLLVWVVAFFLLIDFFLMLVSLGLSLWLLLPIWGATLWFADRVTDWIVPNIKVATKQGPL